MFLPQWKKKRPVETNLLEFFFWALKCSQIGILGVELDISYMQTYIYADLQHYFLAIREVYHYLNIHLLYSEINLIVLMLHSEESTLNIHMLPHMNEYKDDGTQRKESASGKILPK